MAGDGGGDVRSGVQTAQECLRRVLYSWSIRVSLRVVLPWTARKRNDT